MILQKKLDCRSKIKRKKLILLFLYEYYYSYLLFLFDVIFLLFPMHAFNQFFNHNSHYEAQLHYDTIETHVFILYRYN